MKSHNIVTPFSQEEIAELNELRNDINHRYSALREYLIRKASEHALLKPGDEIYNIDTGEMLGIIKNHHHPDPVFEFTVDYCYFKPDNSNKILSTSSSPSIRFGNKQDAINELKRKLQDLENERNAL
jgi:hypothetical protein